MFAVEWFDWNSKETRVSEVRKKGPEQMGVFWDILSTFARARIWFLVRVGDSNFASAGAALWRLSLRFALQLHFQAGRGGFGIVSVSQRSNR
jgi:hypothetical protein